MKYQMTCPKCHREFTYDNGYFDTNITRLGIEIQSILLQLADYNLLPRDEQRQKKDWKLRTQRALAYKQKELSELKAIRKVSDQQVKSMEFQMFKNLVKDAVGNELYHKWLDMTEKELEAYRISGLMRHEYTRASSRPEVINISGI